MPAAQALVQEGKPVAFSSKTLTPSEKMYANIEESCWRLHGERKSFTHVYGRRVFVETDHKPLEFEDVAQTHQV